MKSFKTIAVVVIALAVMVASISAFACANDTFIGYDQLPDANGEYGKLYKCPLKGRVVRDGSAETDEWRLAFYEEEYPHRAIETLILDGQETGYLRFDGEYADVNTKEVPEFWESKAPYNVYNRLYSDFTGKFEPTHVLKTDYVTAPVSKDWVNKGFDKYVKVDEDSVVDYSHIYGENEDKIDFTWHVLEELKDEYYDKIIAGFDVDGKPIYTKAFVEGKAKDAYSVFEHAINNVSWLELTGPNYADGGEMSFFPMEKIANGANPDWYDNYLVTDNKYAINDYSDDIADEDADRGASRLTKADGSDADDIEKINYVDEFKYCQDNLLTHLGVSYEDPHATIEWKTAGYELVAPYRYYQVLYVNGVPMDGSKVDIVGYDVKKEEVVEVKQDYADEIHLIEKPIKQVGYESSAQIDYVITPNDSKVYKTIDEKIDYKVVENYLLEKVHDKITMLPEDDQYEIRFVKVSTQPGKSTLPYIWRYAGGFANPEIEWKDAFAENAAPYEIFEEKYVDGIRTYEYRPTGRYATDMPSVSTVMGQPRILTVQLSADIDTGKLEQALIDADYEFVIAGRNLSVVVPGEIYPGFEITEEWYENWAFELDQIIKNPTVINVEK